MHERETTTSAQASVDCCVTSLHDVTDDATTPEVTEAGRGEAGAVLLVAAHGVLAALSATGNALVLYVIGRHLGYRTTTNVYITTLCVADVMTSLAGLLVAGACVAPALGGHAASLAYDVVRRSLSLVSTCMTSALVVDRYLTVVRLHRVQTPRHRPTLRRR